MSIIVANYYKLKSTTIYNDIAAYYHAIHVETGKHFLVKIEPERRNKHRFLKFESKVLRILNDEGSFPGIPKIYAHGKMKFSYKKMYYSVLDPRGKTLNDFLNICGGKFSLKTVVMLGMQIFTLLKFLHSKNFVRRGCSPMSFRMGCDKYSHYVYITGLGSCKKYRDDNTMQHITEHISNNLHIVYGHPSFCSIAAHRKHNQSRRDDIESVAVMLPYFLRGTLPWIDIRAHTQRDTFDLIGEKKINTSINEICVGCPSEFAMIIDYSRRLAFVEEPNYNYIMSLLQSVADREGFKIDWNFDWLPRNDIENNDEQIIIHHDEDDS